MNHINYFKNYLVKDNNLTSDNLGFLRGNMFEDLYKPYKNYQIKEVTPENSFLCDLNYDFSDHSHNLHQILGHFFREMDNGTFSQEDLQNLRKDMELAFKEYIELTKRINDEWIRRGKPLSVKRQEIEKAYYDALDDEKDYNARY